MLTSRIGTPSFRTRSAKPTMTLRSDSATTAASGLLVVR